MPLHPDLDAFLELAAAAPKPLSEMTAADARIAYNRSTLALDTPGPRVPVEPLQFPGRDGATIQARLYSGPAAGAAPVLLFFHGGGYVLGDLDSHDSLCRTLAQETPCAVLAIDYRRAPEHRFPAAFHDAEDAYAWLRRHGADHGLDTARVAVGGDSVGGTLATALCISAREAGLPLPRHQLLLYPCTAAHQDSASHRRLESGFLLERRTLQWMFGQYLRDGRDRLDWRFAPLQAHDLRGLPPVTLALAEYDPLVDEGHQYADRLRDAGVPVNLHIHAGMVHDFARLGNVVEDAGTLRLQLARALGTALNKSRAAPSCP